jgi:hypothetical protein
MAILNSRRLAACILSIASFVQAASAAEILIADAKSQPESLTMAPGGALIVGSASSPFVYKVRPGSSTAEQFIDASAEGPGTFFLGVLTDASSNTLWTCQLTPVPNTTPAQRHTTLRSSVGTCRETTRRATILRLDRTRRSTSPTPQPVESTG